MVGSWVTDGQSNSSQITVQHIRLVGGETRFSNAEVHEGPSDSYSEGPSTFSRMPDFHPEVTTRHGDTAHWLRLRFSHERFPKRTRRGR
jgi:hypothetical protein